MDLDLELISGNFFYKERIPKDKEYLLKYFKGELQEQFLIYYICFKKNLKQRGAKCFYNGFFDHTGMICRRKVLRRYIRRFELLEVFCERAKAEGDIERLAQIRSGNLKLKELGDRDR